MSAECCCDEDQEFQELKDMGMIMTMLWIIVILCLICLAYLLIASVRLLTFFAKVWQGSRRVARGAAGFIKKGFGRYFFRTEESV